MIHCKLFGHDRQPWFKTVAGACSQFPFSDGIQCRRCGKLLWVWDDNDEPRKPTAQETREAAGGSSNG